MDRFLDSPYACPEIHAAVSAVIRARSTNPRDVRDVALDGLDLSACERVLDLGCGFGFMGEAVAQRVAPGALVVGVDGCPANEAAFRVRVEATGRRAAFRRLAVAGSLPWPDAFFPLVVSSYALYFFPSILPEIARVLAPGGRFVALTHRADVLQDLFARLGETEAAVRLAALMARFSAESGAGCLAGWFSDVEVVPYPNTLRFGRPHAAQALAYLDFKVGVLVAGEPGPVRRARIGRALDTCLDRLGEVVVAKDDVAFRARRPPCPP
ncbi:MAG: methyltransferase domain-containing protein [Deltaproteobacteria bacterium]|nr:methyltransferase domain-containing protein [Deltaproteobacteria bacterium]